MRMALGKRLEKLETRQQGQNLTPLFIATETTPGHYSLDDGRELSESELEALPGSGLVICLPPDHHEV